MKTFLKASLLVILAIAVSVPMLAQGPSPSPKPDPGPSRTIDWMIKLTSSSIDGPVGTAHYTIVYFDPAGKRMFKKLSVECEYASYPNGSVLDVFLLDQQRVNTKGQYIGRMEVQNGNAAMLLTSLNAPKVTRGTNLIVTLHNGPAIMVGRF